MKPPSSRSAETVAGSAPTLRSVTTLDEGLRDNEMYVGAIRARNDLVIISPKSFENWLKSDS